MFKNTSDNKRYYTLNHFFRTKFGKKVFKVPLDIDSPCPNQNTGGCIYCSNKSTATISNKNLNIIKQFEDAKTIMENKWPDAYYIPYFQSGTNTSIDINIMKNYVDMLLRIPKVVGIDIATRPDFLSDEWLEYFHELNEKTFLMVELGLQSANNNTLKFINRGHDVMCFSKTVEALKHNNIFTIAHIINGLPTDSPQDMINTAKYVNSLNVDGIKIHMLFINKNTPLEKMYLKNNFHILSKEEYINIVCEQLEYLNENIIIMRITGDPVKEELIAPDWLLKKFVVLNDIDKEMVKRDIYQGDKVS